MDPEHHVIMEMQCSHQVKSEYVKKDKIDIQRSSATAVSQLNWIFCNFYQYFSKVTTG